MGEMIAEYARHRITAHQFSKMAEVGIFDADEHVELVEGVLISYAPPQGPLHAGAVRGVADTIRERLGRAAILWPQLPVVIGKQTELEPDLAILAVRDHAYRKTLPRVPDVRAVLEIAESSLARDRGRKLRIYAAAGIAEYWVVDVRADRIEIYREPRGREYASYRLALRGDSVAFAAFPDVVFAVDELLG